MATSSIFANVEINDFAKAEQFISALEESEKAQIPQKRTAAVISVTRDGDAIRKLMEKRFPTV